jgi:hypothetical protein
VQRRLALGSIAVVALLAGACGSTPAPSDEVASAGEVTQRAGSARIETSARVSYGSPPRTHEVRWTEHVDYRRNRSVSVEHETGCRTITLGDRTYSELPSEDGLPEGKRWVAWDHAVEVDSEELFEQAREKRTTTEDSPFPIRALVTISSTCASMRAPSSTLATRTSTAFGRPGIEPSSTASG